MACTVHKAPYGKDTHPAMTLNSLYGSRSEALCSRMPFL